MVKKRIKQSFLLLCALMLLGACAKKTKNPNWLINEVMVINENNFTDNFGDRSGWIEIYNNTSATQDLAGMFLTTDKNNPKMYAIPLGDVLTKIKPQQHALFMADAKPYHGTFHTNFTLDPTKENYIALYDVDGKTLLDEITVPAGMKPDQTYGYENDGYKYDAAGNYSGTILNRVTPSSNNKVVGENPKLVELKTSDSRGFTLTLTSMFVVFLGLLLLYFIFKLSGNTAKSLSQRKAAKAGSVGALRSHTQLSGEMLAAISAAIYDLGQVQHDIEYTILTIDQVKRNYSPWNSKRQSLRQLPQR